MLQSAFNAGIRPAWFVADEVYSRTLFVLHWSFGRAHQALARYYHYRSAQAPFRSFLSLTSFLQHNRSCLPSTNQTSVLLSALDLLPQSTAERIPG